jgi:HEAT repeat protein
MPLQSKRWVAAAGAGLILLLAVVMVFVTRKKPGSGPDALLEALGRSPSLPAQSAAGVQAKAAHQPDATELAAILRDSSWQARLGAVNSLGGRRDLPAARRAELLLAGLKREIARPTDSLRFPGGYLASSSTFRLQFMRVIEGLGSDAIGPARSAAEESSAEAREWMLLARAGAGDADAVTSLRELLKSSRSGAVRMTAARLLGRFRDRSAIPELRTALGDPFAAPADQSDLRTRSSFFYPVREQAAGALRALGVKVQRSGDKFSAD